MLQLALTTRQYASILHEESQPARIMTCQLCCGLGQRLLIARIQIVADANNNIHPKEHQLGTHTTVHMREIPKCIIDAGINPQTIRPYPIKVCNST
jgi:hypothetical protein